MSLFARVAGAIGVVGILASFAGCSGVTTRGGSGGGCEHGGKRYSVGESFADTDGCNQCACGESGEVACTNKACEPGDGCISNGKLYSVGSVFSSEDGCNQCTCTENGGIACTARACENRCEGLEASRQEELAKVQQCATAAECGQPIAGSSCGCTRNLVARNDADLTRYVQLQADASTACGIGGSPCDCPAADGFACVNQRCAWNYTIEEPEPHCTEHKGARLCVRGTPTADGETLEVGDTLSITVGAEGCFSSSCSKVYTAECSVGDDAGFNVSASFCVGNTAAPDKACTDDCGDVHADCSFGQPLSAGEHQVKLDSIVVGFQVPAKLPRGGLCARN